MENASKALLIAGGVLLVMMIVALLVFAWNTFTNFYSSQDELIDIVDLSEFNLQFTAYDRDNVMGYELISLANKISDYNFRRSNLEDARTSGEAYTPIAVTINFINEDNRKKLMFDYAEGDRNKLFLKDSITQSDTSNMIKKILDEASFIEALYGDSNNASKLARSINSLLLSKINRTSPQYSGLEDKDIKTILVNRYNSITGSELTEYGDEKNPNVPGTVVNALLGDNIRIYKYYEYYKFKTAIFKCNLITYDDTSGRVKSIDFVFTGKIE